MIKSAPYITDDNCQPQGISYGFFGRKGGLSQGPYDSLNCGKGSDDLPHMVDQNRQIAAHSLGAHAEALASVYQIHSADVVTINTPSDALERPKADGLVTSLPDIALSILTADCTPLLFADAQNGVIGACHAGWRGAASGVIQNTITAMCAIGATTKDISCLIGPTIAKASYQVGLDMKEAVLDEASWAETFFTADHDPDKFLFDLPAFAADCVHKSDVHTIFDVGLDTYGESGHYFSHRRATHLGQSDTGRQIAIIVKPTS